MYVWRTSCLQRNMYFWALCNFTVVLIVVERLIIPRHTMIQAATFILNVRLWSLKLQVRWYCLVKLIYVLCMYGAYRNVDEILRFRFWIKLLMMFEVHSNLIFLKRPDAHNLETGTVPYTWQSAMMFGSWEIRIKSVQKSKVHELFLVHDNNNWK